MPYEPKRFVNPVDPYLDAELKQAFAPPLVVDEPVVSREARIRSLHSVIVLDLEARKSVAGEFKALRLSIGSPDGRPNVITLSHEATRALIGFLQESL